MEAHFAVGAQFPSYAQFEEDLSIYKRSTFSEYFIKDCRTLESAKKRYPLRVEKANEALKYYFIKLMCVHGGKYKKKETSGERKTSSMRQGCNAFIYVKLSEDGKNLVITDMCENHNHELSQELFDFLPRQRRLAPDKQQEVLDMLELNADKKLVQEKYSSELNKKITLRDLSNLKAKGNAKQPSFEETIQKVQKDHDCTVKVMLDDAQNLRALYLQDSKMKKEFEAYPEVIFADCTYKLTDIRAPVFILMVENGNGESNVVAAGVFVTEEKDVYKWFMNCFKSANPAARNTKVVMTDKDMTERVIFKEVLPDVRLRICLFHTLKIFRREISAQEMGLSPADVVLIRSTLQKMCYATSVEEFDNLYQQLQDISPERVMLYFDKNWKDNLDEWTSISHFQADTLLNRTNNRVESFNAKLKSVVTHFSSLDKFLKHFFVVIKCLRLEREASAAKVLSRITTETFQSEEEHLYSLYTTPYAFRLIQQQFQAMTVTTQEICNRYQATENECNCSFFVSLHLPCKHILKCREASCVSLYDENLIKLRWSRKHLNITREPPRQDVLHCTVDVVPRKKPVTTHEKFKRARVVTNRLAALISESSAAEQMIKLLEKIYEKWAIGEEVKLLGDDGVIPPVSDEEGATPPIGDEDETPLLSNEDDETPLVVEEDETPLVVEEGDKTPLVVDVEDATTSVGDLEEETPLVDDEDGATPPIGDKPSVSQVAFEHCYAGKEPASPQLCNVKVPSKVKVRGRPKGSTTTAIGLPRASKGKKKAFPKKQHFEKINIILSWFITEDVVEKVKKGHLIMESDIECRPEKIHCGCIDDNVDIFIVRPFFSDEGWATLLNVIENKKKNNVWVCDKCHKNVTENSICCDACLMWYHFKCVGVKKAPKREWFCILCK